MSPAPLKPSPGKRLDPTTEASTKPRGDSSWQLSELAERQQAQLWELRELNAALLERIAEREAELEETRGGPGCAAADGVRPVVGEEPPGATRRQCQR